MGSGVGVPAISRMGVPAVPLNKNRGIVRVAVVIGTVKGTRVHEIGEGIQIVALVLQGNVKKGAALAVEDLPINFDVGASSAPRHEFDHHALDQKVVPYFRVASP